MKVSTYLVDLYIQKIYLTGLRILTYWWYLCWLLVKPGDTFPNPDHHWFSYRTLDVAFSKLVKPISAIAFRATPLFVCSQCSPYWFQFIGCLWLFDWHSGGFPYFLWKMEIMFSPESSCFILRGFTKGLLHIINTWKSNFVIKKYWIIYLWSVFNICNCKVLFYYNDPDFPPSPPLYAITNISHFFLY